MASTLNEINFEDYLPELKGVPVEKVAQNLFAGVYGMTKEDVVARHIANNNIGFTSRANLFAVLKGVLPYRKDGKTLAHVFARCGYVFTVADLIELGNPKDKNGDTVAHIMAEQGYIFTLSDLIELGDPRGYLDFSVSKTMAMKGYQFLFSDLLTLEKISPGVAGGIAYSMVGKGHEFSFSELITIGNPVTSWGDTVAHAMAEKGHRFSIEELLKLGNPATKLLGWTVAHIMAYHGYEFSPDEIKILGNPLFKSFTYPKKMITIDEAFQQRIKEETPKPYICKLTFIDDKPIFKAENISGLRLDMEFGKVMDGEYWRPQNAILLNLEKYNSVWIAKPLESDSWVLDKYNFLLQKIYMLRLVDKINEAIRIHQDLDLTPYPAKFSNACDGGSFALTVEVDTYYAI